jgi:hypothetical protein
VGQVGEVPKLGVLPGHGSSHDGGLSNLPEKRHPHEHGKRHLGSIRTLPGLGFQAGRNHELDALLGAGTFPGHGGRIVPDRNRVKDGVMMDSIEARRLASRVASRPWMAGEDTSAPHLAGGIRTTGNR